MSSPASRTFLVEGMTCEHCVRSVREEVSELDGVSAVDVDLGAGRLTLSGDVTEDAVAAAVAEAGYEVRPGI